jgi:hypothetical protein
LKLFKLFVDVMPKGRERELAESRNATEDFSFFALQKDQGVILVSLLKLFAYGDAEAEEQRKRNRWKREHKRSSSEGSRGHS